MSQSPLEYTESLRVGTVEFVSPDEIKVSLEVDAPESIALNTGVPRPFPRVNSYVLIRSDEGYLVGQVEWVTIEKSNYPKLRGMKDSGLIDLPYPLRKMSLNPLGTLRKTINTTSEEIYRFRRGVDAFPSVGDGVLLPTQKQLHSIVESGENRRVKIGTSTLAGNADVCVDPDRLFGRHLAVLGNTGSGKSCSVAGLIRWSLEAVQQTGKNPNARFIVLDPNGEYARAFAKDTGKLQARLFKVNPEQDEKQLLVPLWFWNSAEWCAFTQASERTQKPTLQQALRLRRNKVTPGDYDKPKEDLLNYLQGALSNIDHQISNNAPFASNREGIYWGFIEMLKTISSSLSFFRQESDELSTPISKIIDYIEDLYNNKCKNEKGYYKPFVYGDLDIVRNYIESTIQSFGGETETNIPVSEDTPIRFSGKDLLVDLNFLAANSGNRQLFDFFITRIRTMLADTRMKPIISEAEEINLDQWLTDYIGGNRAENGNITIIDLSLVPPEIVHIVTAVIARMIFEALQRYRKLSNEHKTLPTVLVMEEAHTFVKRYKEDSENQDASSVCCKVFERIAREGRKFGLGLVLSSQRPSELSPTVLSQCNTFLLHRISNDRDQDLVHRFVPDNLRGLLRELPSLPSQNAILLGWASELPLLVRMNDLPKEQQPQSDDPDFWKVWSGEEPRDVNWKDISDDWQRGSSDNVSPKSNDNDNNDYLGDCEF
jgi:DNA helicase HerA-like ATPase